MCSCAYAVVVTYIHETVCVPFFVGYWYSVFSVRQITFEIDYNYPGPYAGFLKGGLHFSVFGLEFHFVCMATYLICILHY